MVALRMGTSSSSMVVLCLIESAGGIDKWGVTVREYTSRFHRAGEQITTRNASRHWSFHLVVTSEGFYKPAMKQAMQCNNNMNFSPWNSGHRWCDIACHGLLWKYGTRWGGAVRLILTLIKMPSMNVSSERGFHLWAELLLGYIDDFITSYMRYFEIL